MSLRDWQRNSWLVEHKSSRDEITALLAIVERDLANAKVRRLAMLRDRFGGHAVEAQDPKP